MRTVVLKEGCRDDSAPHQTRRLSMVQLGLRWLHYAVEHGFVWPPETRSPLPLPQV